MPKWQAENTALDALPDECTLDSLFQECTDLSTPAQISASLARAKFIGSENKGNAEKQ